jgi:hypothetical protein
MNNDLVCQRNIDRKKLGAMPMFVVGCEFGSASILHSLRLRMLANYE